MKNKPEEIERGEKGSKAALVFLLCIISGGLLMLLARLIGLI